MRAWAETLASGGRSRGRAAVRERERSDGWGYPVSGCVREGAGARSVDAGRVGMGRPAAQFPGRPLCSAVFFFFYAIYDVYV